MVIFKTSIVHTKVHFLKGAHQPVHLIDTDNNLVDVKTNQAVHHTDNMISFLKIFYALVSLVIISLHLYYFEEKLYTMKSHLVNQVTSSYAGKNTSNITSTTNILRELAHDKKQENVESSMAQCKRHAPANQGIDY